MVAGVALLLALAAGADGGAPSPAADPCVATDAQGRTFRVCFDPANRLELSAGGAAGTRWPESGGALDARLALRWRHDTRGGASGARLEWLRDQTFLGARALFAGGGQEPREARAVLWQGVFVRHREEPFVLLPGRGRLPFPFDVGIAFAAGGARWRSDLPHALTVEVARASLLLDLPRHGLVRRAAFGPEVSYEVDLARGEAPAQRVAPFTGGVVDVWAASEDGLWVATAVARAATALRVPGGWRGRWSAAASVERVVVAVNDRPLALYLEVSGRGGSGDAAAEGSVGLRLGL